MEQKIKHCNKCGLDKPIDQFPSCFSTDRNKTIVMSRCRECKREADRDRIRKKVGTPEYNKYMREYHNHKRWLTTGVSSPVYFNVCGETGRLFTTRIKQRTISDMGRFIRNNRKECNISANEKARIKYRMGIGWKQCNVCGKYYILSDSSTCDVCSFECREIARKSAKIGGTHRDRARHYGVKYEPINRIKIFDRDDWKCQECGIDTPIELTGLNRDNSPELDHIIPLSKGGNHEKNNVQCLCRECNGNKSNIIGWKREKTLSGVTG
jgi:5-methylcytosine-specific restriction endonuclease McrA